MQALPASGPLHMPSRSLAYLPHLHPHTLHGRLLLILPVSASAARRGLLDYPVNLSLNTLCVSFVALGNDFIYLVAGFLATSWNLEAAIFFEQTIAQL